MEALLTSDLHLGHKNIHKHRANFTTAEEHHNFMIEKILKLNKRTMLIIIGDFLFDCPEYEYYINKLKEAKCHIKLIMGNHDSLKLYKEDIFDIQLPLYSYKNMWISHAPIHPQELRNRYGNIHGHLHLEHVKTQIPQGYTYKNVEDKRYFNVNIDVNDYEFVKLNTIKRYFNIMK